MKLKNILKVLDMMNECADVYVRDRGNNFIPLTDMKLMDFELGIYELDKNYKLVLEEVKQGDDDDSSENCFPKLYVQLHEDCWDCE